MSDNPAQNQYKKGSLVLVQPMRYCMTFTEGDINNLAEEERSFATKITIKVLGYINGDGLNDPKPEVTTKENVVEIRMSRERAVLEDEIPWKKKDNKYRPI